MKLTHYSPSTLNLFVASLAMFTMEKVLGIKQPVGAPAHRGTAVESGVTVGLMKPDLPERECIDLASEQYHQLMALSGDPRRMEYAKTIPSMVTRGLEELRPYGIPSGIQKRVEWHPEGISVPIVGYLDYEWDKHGIITDLKTTKNMPSQIKESHARQVSLYCSSNNYSGRLTYVTPQRRATYQLEAVEAHREALRRIAMACEAYLALSDDPGYFIRITSPDRESFYFSDPAARQQAFEIWGY